MMDDLFFEHLWQKSQFPVVSLWLGMVNKAYGINAFIGWDNHIPQKDPDLSLTSRDQLSTLEVLSSIFDILVKLEVRFTIF